MNPLNPKNKDSKKVVYAVIHSGPTSLKPR
jgi:hypothetical protein